ncbi:MAG: type III secretion system chaperone [Pseudomonadota bacterium]
MTRLDYAQDLCNQLGHKMGMNDLAFDDQGRLSLTFDDLLVTFHYQEEPLEMIAIYADLGHPPVISADLALLLFEANLQSWLHRTMTIGVEAGTDHVVGAAYLPLVSTDFTNLMLVVENMLKIGNKIQAELKRPEWMSASSSDTAQSQAAPGLDPSFHQFRV